MSWEHPHNDHMIEADSYDEYPYAGYTKILERIVKACEGCERVLFVGIGVGDIARTLYDQGVAITGIDFSQKMIDICTEAMPSARLLTFDLEKHGLPELGETYDAVVSLYYLHTLAFGEKLDMIADMAQLLKPKGKIYIGDVAFASVKAMEACAEEFEDLFDEDEEDGAFIASDLKALSKLPSRFDKTSFCSGVITLG